MRNKLVWLLAVSALFAFCFCVQISAETKAAGDVVVARGQTVKNAIAINGGVVVYGHVTRDAVAVIGDVRIKPGGIVDGDAVASVGKVITEPGGIVRGDTVSNAGSGHKTGGGHAEKVGGNVTIEKGETVNKASVVKGDLRIYGHVTGDANAVLGNIYVEDGGRVDGDANAVMGSIYVKKGGRVERDAYAVSGKVVQQGGSVGGDIGSIDIPVPKWLIDRASQPTTRTLFSWIWWGFWLAAGILVSVLLVALFPARMRTVTTAITSKPGWSLLYGVTGLLAMVPLAILLALTCVGILVIPFEFMLAFVMWLFGAAAVNLAIGLKIGQITGRPFASMIWAVILGTLVIGFVGLIPFGIGDAVVFLVELFGFGAVIMTGFGAGTDWFARRFDRTAVAPSQQGPAAPPPTVPPIAPPPAGGPDVPQA